VRRFLATLLVAAALPAATDASVQAGRVQVVAWSTAATKDGLPPADAVSGGIYCKPRAIHKLYAFVRFSGMRDGVPSSATWYFNRKKVFVFKFRWEDGETGRTAFDIYRTKGALAEGVYGIEVRSGGRVAGSGTVRVRFGSC
jgi:hypothetical protein